MYNLDLQYLAQERYRIFPLLSACAYISTGADSTKTYVQYMVMLASLASLIIYGIDADSGALGSERSVCFDALAKNQSRDIVQ